MLRFILICLLLLVSLLTVFDAPAYYLWLLAIIVTEYPLPFAALTITLLVSGYWLPKYRIANTIVGIIALVLFLWPVACSYQISKTLKEQVAQAFENKSGNQDPIFSFYKLFKSAPQGNYKTYAYATQANNRLTLNYYKTPAEGKRPCIIVIHGGSWSSGNSRQLPELNAFLASKGYQVASINYRLAPQYKSPDPVTDVRSAIAYLHKHANALQIDTANLILLGRSAGAQIALLAGYTIKAKGIKGVIDFYGPADMVWGYTLPANPWVMDSKKVMENYLGGKYSQVPYQYTASSPIRFVNQTTPPTLIIHGANDVLVAYEHSRRLDVKLTQNHIKHFWLKLPWATHGFDYNLNGPGGQLSTYAVVEFIVAVTKQAN